MSAPDYEKLKLFYSWLREQMAYSKMHYKPGGQKVAKCFWMNPSIRREFERALKDMDCWTESGDTK